MLTQKLESEFMRLRKAVDYVDEAKLLVENSQKEREIILQERDELQNNFRKELENTKLVLEDLKKAVDEDKVVLNEMETLLSRLKKSETKTRKYYTWLISINIMLLIVLSVIVIFIM